MKIRAIDFVQLNVSDPERAMHFYRDILGMDFPLSESTPHYKEFDSPPVAFALRRDEPAKGYMTVALAVDDVDAAVEELRAKGVTIFMEPRETPVCRGALILDPDGAVLMLHQRKDGTAG